MMYYTMHVPSDLWSLILILITPSLIQNYFYFLVVKETNKENLV